MTTKFALATLSLHGIPTAAIKVGETYWLLARARQFGYFGLSDNVKALLTDWPISFPALQKFAEACAAGNVPQEAAIQEREAEIGLVIQYPNKLLAIGANYTDHGGLPAVRPPYPVMFQKPPTTCLCGPGQMFLPAMTDSFDWEAELAVVIGKRLRRVRGAAAREGIAGYTIGVDYSCRDLSRRPDFRFGFDFLMGKGQDATNPIGPVLVPAAFISDPQNLKVMLSVNGDVKQNFSTANMIYSVEEQICALSDIVTLEPGDVILTGTASGIAARRGPNDTIEGDFLKVGDVVDVTIDGIGTLRSNLVTEPPPDDSWKPLS